MFVQLNHVLVHSLKCNALAVHEKTIYKLQNTANYQNTVESRYLQVDWTICLQVQFTQSANELALRVIWTLKKSPTPKYGWRKQPKCIFDSDRRFEFPRI